MSDCIVRVVFPTESSRALPNALIFVHDTETGWVRLYVCGSKEQCLQLLEECDGTDAGYAEQFRSAVLSGPMLEKTDEADLQVEGWPAMVLYELCEAFDVGYKWLPSNLLDDEGGYTLVDPAELSPYAILAWHHGPAAEVHLLPDRLRVRAELAPLQQLSTDGAYLTTLEGLGQSRLPESEPSVESASFGGQAALFVACLLLDKIKDSSKRAQA